MQVFSIRGGGSKPIQPFWGTFLCPTILEFWVKKGGGGGQRPEAVFVIPMNDKPDAIPPLRNEKVTQGVSVIPV